MSLRNKPGPDGLGMLCSEAEGVTEPPTAAVSPGCPSWPWHIPVDEQAEADKGK